MASVDSCVEDVHPFLVQKWTKIFHTLFDQNNSQSVEHKDFYLVIKEARNIYGNDSEQMRYARASLQTLWQGLLEIADKDHSKTVDLQEWLTLMQKTLQKRPAPVLWFEKYGEYMFKLFDVSADDVLDIAEYVDGMYVYGLSTQEATEVFKKIAVDSEGRPVKVFDYTHFHRLWDDFFYSTDKHALGNHMFGLMSIPDED